MAIQKTIHDDAQFTLEVKPKTRRGNDAQVQDPQWLSSDSTLLTVTVDPTNPLKATVAAAGPLTPVGGPLPKALFSCDADLGEGIVALQGECEVAVIASQATVVDLVAGEETPQP